MTMNEPMPERDLATPLPEKRRRGPSLVWLMPLLAILVAFYVVWQNYQDRGPLITVTFPSASGIQEGATELRIRDIRVGVVEEVGFSDGMAAVEARIRVDKELAQYVDEDAQFWLVEPQVSARGVTGIGTILSGVYIEADWDGEVGAPAGTFTALPTPPLAAFAEEGTRVILRTRAGGQLAAGAPVLATGIEVGRIGQPVLSETGNTVTMEAFIAAPYDRRLTTNSRFWDASGLSVNVGTGGLALRVDSLAALLEGGVNFGTPVTGGEPVEDGFVFDVFASEDEARADAFEGTSDPDIAVSILLDADVSGLGVGTLVRFRGVKAGEVVDVVGVAPEAGSDERVRLLIDMNIQPTRIGLRPGLSDAQLREVLAARVARGLRMRLSTEGLFGQTSVIELANVPDAEPAELAAGLDGRLIFPTSETVQSEGDTGVESLVARVQRLPIEDVMTSAAEAMTSISRLAGAAEGVLTSDGVRALPATIDGTLGEVQGLVADVRQGGAIDSFNATLRSVEGTMASVDQVARSLPAITDRLVGTAEDTLTNFSQLAGTANDVLTSDGVSRLPATVDATLAEVNGLVSEFREGGAIESLNATLGSAQQTLASVEEAARVLPDTVQALTGSATAALENVAGLTTVAGNTLASIDAVTQTLPETVERLTGTANDALVNVSELAGTANGVLASEAFARLPETIDGTLGEVRGLVEDVRAGGAIDNLNATLASAQTTLASVEATVATLPGQVETLSAAATVALADVSGLANAARGVLEADGFDRLPATIDATLGEVRGAVAEFREGGAVANLNAALASAESALASAETTLASVDVAARELPAQIERLTTGASAALENVGTLADTANGVLGAEGADQLPATINGTLRELQAVAATLREGGAIESLNETLASARTTLASVDTAAKSLPEVVGSLNEAANGALANVSSLAGTAEGVLKADGIDRLPATLDGTLSELRALSEEIRQGGAIESLNATLRSAEAALFSVDNAAQSLPALVDRLNATADGLQGVVSGYAPNSRVYEDLRGVLREVSSTAEAFRSLARTIERRPNSLITGR